MTTLVPTVHINETEKLFLACNYCMKAVEPIRDTLATDGGFRYEDATCPECNRQIAGLVVKMKRNRRATDKEG